MENKELINDINNNVNEYIRDIKENIDEKKALVITHGCQMNEHDSEKITWLLEKMGYNFGPLFQIRQPSYYSVTCENDIKLII